MFYFFFIIEPVNRNQIYFHSDNKEAVVNELKTFSQLIKDALDEIEEVRGVSKDQFIVTTRFHICTETEDIQCVLETLLYSSAGTVKRGTLYMSLCVFTVL